ncbi:MAG: 2Fe-2S iron-sulfur cluster-binding protein [Pontimonas sp.]
MLDFQDPQVWWFLTRASAMVAWVLLTLTAVWGILLKTRILRGADNPEWLTVTHRYISGLAMAMIATHMGTLLLDEYIQFGWTDILVPFATTFEPLPVALGIIAFWLIILVQLTALGSKWLPEGLWKGVHLSSYLVLVLVALHSGLVGTDVGTPWYTVVSLILITTATLAGIVRLVIAGREKPPARSASPTERVTPPTRPTFQARVVDRTPCGDDLAEFTLAPVDSATELEWESGAHLTLHLGNGLERQYSLAGDPADSHTLRLGVLNTRGEGGGSSWVHNNLQVGDLITCDYPKNHFPLKPAKKYQFVASGVGITPIRSMLYSIPAGREWSLLYLGRTTEDMLFADELRERYGDRVTLWASKERGSRADLEELLDPGADVYACGSAELINSLEQLVAPKRLHVERFEPKARVSNGKLDSFTIEAETSGVTVTVGPDQSALEALEEAGIAIQASCRRGTCGTCELAVLEGEPEHLDSVMSDADKDELGVMYPCVSRAKTPTLSLRV